MRAALANLDQGEFAEGHELDRKVARQAVALNVLLLTLDAHADDKARN